MADIEKVIKGLECCSTDAYKCNECPYIQHNPLTNICTGYVQICADALELLKEQQEKIKLQRLVILEQKR